jgi:choline-sulfatase
MTRASTAPNILLVMADQLAPHFTSTYGHPVVMTPNLDALAERGIRFDAAYCHSPLCAPSRFTMLSGRSASVIGAWDNAAEFPAAVPTLAHYLRLAGYRTTLSGKMHFVGPDQLHGFDERLTTDIYPADFAWTPDWDNADERIDKWYHNMDVLAEAGPAVTTYQIDYDEEVGYAARRRLLDFARDPDPRPFLLCASFIHPHDPYVARPEWWNLYDHDAIDLPEPYDLGTADPHTLRIRRGIQADTIGGPGETFPEDQLRNARHGYYANTSYFDDWLGRLVTTLDETNQLDTTVIIVTADHGDMLGDRGVFFKMSFHERSARVPLVMAGPGVVEGAAVANVCSHLDLLPTLVDVATDGSALSDWLDGTDEAWEGRSLWPLSTGGTDVIDETTGEYMGEMTSHPMFMIRRGRFKFISCSTDPDQLYDLHADPLERVNLAADPAHGPTAAELALEVKTRWDAEAIRRQVLGSQRRRRILHRAMATGPLTSWDYQPRVDAANVYVRNHQDWAEAGPRHRFPPIER